MKDWDTVPRRKGPGRAAELRLEDPRATVHHPSGDTWEAVERWVWGPSPRGS